MQGFSYRDECRNRPCIFGAVRPGSATKLWPGRKNRPGSFPTGSDICANVAT